MTAPSSIRALRRSFVRKLRWRDKWTLIVDNYERTSTYFSQIIPVAFGLFALALVMSKSNSPLTTIVLGNAWASLSAMAVLAKNWTPSLTYWATPDIAVRAALPVSDATVFRRWFTRHYGNLVCASIVLVAAWMAAVTKVDSGPTKWAIAGLGSIVQLVLVIGFASVWASLVKLNTKWASFASLMFFSVMGIHIVFGNEVNFDILRTIVCLVPVVWPSQVLLSVEASEHPLVQTGWLLICAILGVWLCRYGYRRLQSQFQIHEFVHAHGFPSWILTAEGYNYYRPYLYSELARQSASEDGSEATTNDVDDLADERVGWSDCFSHHLGFFDKVVRVCLTQREWRLAAAVPRHSLSWSRSWLITTLFCVLAFTFLLATSSRLAVVAGGFLLTFAVHCFVRFQARAEHLLVLPVTIGEIVWFQSKLYWIRVASWFPHLLLGGLAVGHVYNVNWHESVAITLLWIYLILVTIPAVQVSHYLSIGSHRWMRWRTWGVAFALFVSILLYLGGAGLAFFSPFPWPFLVLFAELVGSMAFVVTGCWWFNSGGIDVFGRYDCQSN